MTQPVFLETDEALEAVRSIEAAAEWAERLRVDTYFWKWVLIAVHNALQAFMVLGCRGSNGLLALTGKSADQWLQAYHEGGNPPAARLDWFPNLYKTVKSNKIRFFAHSKPFPATKQHDESIRKLAALRNEFVHFRPRGWLLEVNGLPSICLDCLQVIEFLCWESGNVHLDEVMRKRVRTALVSLEDFCKDLNAKYAV